MGLFRMATYRVRKLLAWVLAFGMLFLMIAGGLWALTAIGVI